MNEPLILYMVELCIIIVLFILILYWIKQMHNTKLQKRFDSFAYTSVEEDGISFFDKIAILIDNWLKIGTKILKHSVVCQNSAKKYEKYISYEEKDKKESIDYLSIKINISFCLMVLNFVATVIQRKNISFPSLLITGVIGFFLPNIYLAIKFHQKRKRVEEDLLKAIIIMNNSFKAGRNIMQAICTVKNELDGPIADEFKKIYLDMTYGLSIEVVFNRFYERIKLEDAKYIASSLTLLNKTGGNIVRVFNSIEKSFYNKKKLRNELNSLTASSVFVFRVLVALPFVFTLVIYVLNPTYFEPLFSHPLGIIILIFIILFFLLYVLVIKKVLEVNME